MSRHNRRRTRGGHKQSSSGYSISTESYSGLSLSGADPGLLYSRWAPIHAKQPQAPHELSVRSPPSARLWHNRYMAWQARERRQRDERVSLEADKKRIFGIGKDDESYEMVWSGEEDDELCQKMLEYFGALDFIEP